MSAALRLAPEDKLPWFDAVCVVLPQLPYVRELCVRKEYSSSNLLAGLCYTASEAIYHLSDDPLKPYCVRWGSKPHQTHWYLKHRETGQRIDVTASQFPAVDFVNLYNHEVGKGFLTKGPSRRARLVLDRISRDVYFRKTGTAKTCQILAVDRKGNII